MTKRDLALSLLEGAGPSGLTTGDLLRAGVGSRYSARILELRQRGYSISSERIRDGEWRYILEPSASNDGSLPDAPAASPGSASVAAPGSLSMQTPDPGATSSLFDATPQPTSAITGRPRPLNGGSEEAEGGTGSGRVEAYRLPSGREAA